ncbi:MAG: Lysyl-tRNA synthetase [Parcubacteria group bacterium GW2011_GWA2_43_11]|nr:MAG: Lysyl-tRNA synthetase [Parcubacteria group bacterium GW2011_GWC2_42_11]KKS84663.1 MAG: Lysyl-tRNA synthetase [Parcubacteria group bacterium GW2011_GWA2_43_11]
MNESQQQPPKNKQENQNGPGQKFEPTRQFWMNLLITFLILFALTSVFSYFAEKGQKAEEIPLSQVAIDITENKVQSIEVEGDTLTIVYKSETEGAEAVEKKAKKERGTALSDSLANYGVSGEQLRNVAVEVVDESGFSFWLVTLAPFLLPLVFVLILLWFLMRQVKGAGMQAFSFGQSKARVIDPADKGQRITFKDVAGAKEAKEELTEIIDFLKNPKKFIEIGARIPKGVLLMGAPGTGKTLLARAVSGEANVPFFSISGSEFVELFVGVGASRVRDLFKMAKKAAPAIMFIDEIDAVGRVRGTGVGGGNDEREQTLNQILVEMDGFEPNEKIIIMAATNRPDVLDPALLRPGRFDRRVTIDLPDRNDREAILNVHSRKKPLGEDVNILTIAERTVGFSGADLQNLMNEAAILAARENRKKITQYDLIRSIEKVMLGPERKSHVLNKREKRITAYHEAGHALVGSVLPFSDPVHKISIISRGRAAGYTFTLPFEDRRMQSRRQFKDDIAKTLGGYVAEEMVFGDLTTGASNDLQVLTALARNMVTRWGMSEKIGPLALESDGGQTIFGSGVTGKEFSEKVANDIDIEVGLIIKEAYAKAKEVLTTHRKVLDAIAEKLVEVETLERDDFEKILILHGIEPKHKEVEEKEAIV